MPLVHGVFMSIRVNYLYKKIGRLRNLTTEALEDKINNVQDSVDEAFRGLLIDPSKIPFPAQQTIVFNNELRSSGYQENVVPNFNPFTDIVSQNHAIVHNLGYVPENIVVMRKDLIYPDSPIDGCITSADATTANITFTRLIGGGMNIATVRIWVF